MVTYITESLLRKCTDCVNPYLVTKLNLSGKGNDHKIKVIENLHVFVNLVYLNLSDNQISKIENLEKLIRLKNLNLSKNRIQKFDGLERLCDLVTLNLSDNFVSTIPLWVSKKLPLLKTLHLSGNRVETLHQLLRLRDLNNLTVFSFLGNPAVNQLSPTGGDACESQEHTGEVPCDSQSTYRMFVLFHLRTLIVLDGKEVRPEDRRLSDSRFSQEKFANVENSLEQRDHHSVQLTNTNSPSLHNPTNRGSAAMATHAGQSEQAAQISQLQQELSIKDSLLQSKSDELARACLKHYELERELAFHNIDTKISRLLLGPRPKVDGTSLQQIDSTGEQPYIGRCRPRALHSKSCQLTSSDSRFGNSWDFTHHVSAPKLPMQENELLTKQPEASRDSGFHRSSVLESYSLINPLNGPTYFSTTNLMDRQGSCVQELDEIDRPSSAPSRPKEFVSCSIESNLNHQSENSHFVSTKFPGQTPFLEQDINAQRTLPALREVERLAQLLFQRDSLDSKDQYAEKLIEQTLCDLRAQLRNTDGFRNRSSSLAPFSSPPSGRQSGPHVNTAFARSESSMGFYHNGVKSHQPNTPLVHSTDDAVILDPQTRTTLGQSHTNDHFKFSSPMQHSTTSSGPSSRTTGTGRSVIQPEPQGHESRPDVSHVSINSMQCRTQLDVKSSASILRNKNSSESWSPRSASPAYEHHPTIRAKPSAGLRLPGVGDMRRLESHANSHNSGADSTDEGSLDAASINQLRRVRAGKLQSRTHHINSKKCDLPNEPNKTHFSNHRHITMSKFPVANYSSDYSTDAASSEPEQSDLSHRRIVNAPFFCRKSSNGTRNSKACSSTSGTVANNLVHCRDEYKKPPSIDTAVLPGQLRDRQRAPVRRASTGTLDEHIEQFLEMLSSSRKVRASKVDKLRSSLNQMLDGTSDGVLSAGDSSPVPQKRGARQSTVGGADEAIETCSRSRSGELVSGRGTVHSYGDTFTNISRPSPNGFDRGSCDRLDFSATPSHASRFVDRLPPQYLRPSPLPSKSRFLPPRSEPCDESNEFCIPPINPRTCGLCPEPRTTNHANHREHHHSFKAHRTRHENGLPDPKYSAHKLPLHCSTPVSNSHIQLVPRGHSFDPHYPHPNVVENAENTEDEDPGTETTALLNLTQELLGLRKGLKRTRRLNSGRLETALRHISLLEMELQRQRCLTHDVRNARQRQEERNRWEKRLAAVLSELKRCQASIGTLQTQIAELEADKTNFARSRSRLDQQRKELGGIRSILENQREEITRLNELLTQLLGVHPTDASPEDLHRIQTGLVELGQRVEMLRSDRSTNPSQGRRSHSLHTGFASAPTTRMHQNSHHHPISSNPPVPDVMHTFSSSPFCNIPEHHDIEDSLALAQQRIRELKASKKDAQKTLRRTVKAKSKLEDQLQEQSAEIDRLSTEVSMKQKETNQPKSDSFEREVGHQHMASLLANLSSLDTSIRERRDELLKLEEKIKACETQLRSSEAKATEVTAQRDRIQAEHAQLIVELDALHVDTQRAKDELNQARGVLKQTQSDVDSMTTKKQTFQTALTELEMTVGKKEAELQNLSAQVTEIQASLKHLSVEADAGERRIQAQRLLFSENEAAVLEKQASLTRLTQQIEESQDRLAALVLETEEQRNQLELLRSEKHHEVNSAASNSRELASQTTTQQRELFEIQSLLNSCLNEKTQLVTSIETLKAERDQLRTEIQRKHESLTEITSSVDRLKRDMEHMTDTKRLEELRLNDLFAQQQELITQLDNLRAQSIDESEILRKNSETEALRDQSERERQELQRLMSERQTVETELDQLRGDREMIRSHLDKLKNKLEELENKEPLLTEAIANAKSELTQLRAKSEAESACLRQLQEARIASQKEYDGFQKAFEEQRLQLKLIQRIKSVDRAPDERHDDIHLDNELIRSDGRSLVNRATKLATIGVQCTADEFLSSVTSRLSDKATQANSLLNQPRSAELCHSVSKYTELESTSFSGNGDFSKKASSTRESRTIGQSTPSASELDATDLRSELERTKAALAESQRNYKRLKRRTARELAELEQIAVDQCTRSTDLTEQLALVKQQYTQLRSQINNYGLLMDEVITIASHTELSEHGRRLEAALTAVRVELDQTRFTGSQYEPNSSNSHHPSVLRADQPPDELDQPSSSPHSRSLLNLESTSYTNSFGLYKPDRLSQANAGFGNGTCLAGITATTSGLGSSLLPSNPTEANGSSHVTSTLSPLSLYPQPTGGLTKNDWKRIFSSRVAQQRDQAAVDWDKASSKCHGLRDQAQEVRRKSNNETVTRSRFSKQPR